MRLGHVLRVGRVPATAVHTGMQGDLLVLVQNAYDLGADLQGDFLFDQLIRHRIEVPLILDVIVEMHPCLFNFRVFIRGRRQCLEGGFIELKVLRKSCAWPLFKGAAVKLIKQLTDCAIERSHRKKLAMTQTHQYPALDHLHAHLHFGFVLGFIRARRDDGDLIMRRQLLVSGIEVQKAVTLAIAAPP